MTLPPLWPSVLPILPEAGSVTVTQAAGARAFAPERGLPIQRPGQTAPLVTLGMRLPPMSEGQAQAFWQFYNVTLGQGALRFGWVHPLRQVVREMSFLPGSIPSEVDIPGHWRRVSLQVQFVDVQPGWAGLVSITHGYMGPV